MSGIMSGGFKYSKYQLALFDWIENGSGNAIVEAVSGSGKSFSIVHSIKHLKSNDKILFLAFNKSIVDELIKKINQPNITIKTSHSLGYLMLRSHFEYEDSIPSLRVDEYKYRNYIKDTLKTKDFKNKSDMGELQEKSLKLINLCRVYLCRDKESIAKIADKYGYAVDDNDTSFIQSIIEWGIRNLDTIDYTDMISLPNYLDINIKKLKFDWVYVDECQDQSTAMKELFQRCIAKGGRFCGVGDRMQAIMGFAGSNNESFKELCDIPNTTKLELSICYRCPKVIEPIAKKFVPQFQVRENAIEGVIKYDTLISEIKDTGMVICRNTSPLITLYLQLLREGRKCYVKGIDINKNIISKIQKEGVVDISSNLESDGLIPRLYMNLFKTRDEIAKKYKLDLEDATSERTVLYQYDVIKTIAALSEGLTNVYELIERINTIFDKNKEHEGICLITGHKSKGLEAEYVYLLCPSLLPSKFAKKDWEIESERCLEYVIKTRTKNEFHYVSETDFPPSYEDNDIKSLVKRFMEIEQKIKLIYNKHVLSNTLNKTKINTLFSIPEKPKRKREGKKEREKKREIKTTPIPEMVKPTIQDIPKPTISENTIKRLNSMVKGLTVNDAYEMFNDLGIPYTINVYKSETLNNEYNANNINVVLKNNLIEEIL